MDLTPFCGYYTTFGNKSCWFMVSINNKLNINITIHRICVVVLEKQNKKVMRTFN